VSADVVVVMAAYNAAETLDAALAGVAAQSVAPSEVVVVDDCSQDATREVAERWQARLPLEVVTMENNGGPARARHAGVQASRAPVIALVDADDYWLPDHLALCLRRQRHSDHVAVGGRAVRWSALDETPSGLRPPVPADPPPHGQLEWIIRDNGFSSHAVFSRAAYEAVGGFTPRDAGVDDGVEDWDLWIRLARAGVELQRVRRPTFLYRSHATSLSSNASRMANSGLRMLDRLERDVLNADEREALQPALRAARARLRLAAAFACAQAGDPKGARAHAGGALRGERAVALRAAAVAVVPRAIGEFRTRRTKALAREVAGWTVDDVHP
jgi:glycosyltransferase involved in cell wall biosynthesis